MFKFVVIFALLASPALASSIKGYSQRLDESAKGAHRAPFSPIQQQKLIEQRHQETKGGQHLEQQQQFKLEHIEQQKTEELRQEPALEQQREEQQQQIEHREDSAKGAPRYEAKPHLSRDELAKGQQKREEPSKTKVEQQEQVKIEQQKEQLPVVQQKEEKFDKLDQQQRDYDTQSELKEEQRRYEEPAAFVQPILPLTVVEDRSEQQQQVVQIEQQRYDVKGAAQAPVVAPLGEAEPYAFNYQIDGQSRSESGDTKGVVRGQYTLQGADGSSRVVDYVADHNGFRASVNTNEFGTEAKSPASIALRTSQPNAEDITLRLEGKTKEDFAAPLAAGKTSPAKGAAPAATQEWARKGDYQAAKGQKLEELLLPVKAEAKSAQYSAEQTRTSFESATAHRAYKQPAQAPRKQAPGVLVRQLSSAPAVVRAPAPASRVYAQPPAASRYPPAPIAQPPNPRVSFYSAPATGPVNFDEEIPSFIEPEQA